MMFVLPMGMSSSWHVDADKHGVGTVTWEQTCNFINLYEVFKMSWQEAHGMAELLGDWATGCDATAHGLDSQTEQSHCRVNIMC